MKLVIAALLLTAPAAGEQRAAPRLERIEIERRSWGALVSSWTIDAAGNGEHRRAEPRARGAERIVTRRFAAGADGFRKLRILLGRAEARAGGRLACTSRITDAPYGTVKWVRSGGRASELRYDVGCKDVATRRVIDAIREADALAARWAEAGTIVETRKVEQP